MGPVGGEGAGASGGARGAGRPGGTVAGSSGGAREAGAAPSGFCRAAEALVDRHGCRVEYLSGFLDSAEQQGLFEQLREGAPWRREADACGTQQRLSCFLGDTGAVFWYVGLRLEPLPWCCGLEEIRRRLEHILECSLTACLLNNYEEGRGFIAPHSDEVRAHGADKVVASVSLGGARRMLLCPRPGTAAEGEAAIDLVLEPGSVLVMRGQTQALWEHELPLEEPAPHRISLTFRSIVPGFEDALAAAATEAEKEEWGENGRGGGGSRAPSAAVLTTSEA